MLEIDISCHDQYCLNILKPSPKLRVFLRYALTDNFCKSEYYMKRAIASPFLQCDHEEYLLIEFWSDDLDRIQEYVDFLNQKISESEV